MKAWGLAAAGTALWLALPISLVLVAAPGADATCATEAGDRVQGVALDPEQLANAHTIVGVVADHGPPATRRAAVIAVATAMQESSLRNDLRQRDHDSIGLFQQRISVYGAPTAGDPVRSTAAFLTKLLTIPGWATRPLTEVATDVQIPRTDLRDRYARWETLAQDLTDRYWTRPDTRCDDSTDKADLSAGAGIPDGYQLPTDTQTRAAVGFALAQLGKPYRFGAAGPNAYDCSGLTMAAWAAAGAAIGRTTGTQVHTGIPVPGPSAIRPGDLIFIPGSHGSLAHPGHVGMAIGPGRDGRQYLIQAPHTGDVVKVTPVSNWAKQIAAIRRPLDNT